MFNVLNIRNYNGAKWNIKLGDKLNGDSIISLNISKVAQPNFAELSLSDKKGIIFKSKLLDKHYLFDNSR